jgi:hypothetical protein
VQSSRYTDCVGLGGRSSKDYQQRVVGGDGEAGHAPGALTCVQAILSGCTCLLANESVADPSLEEKEKVMGQLWGAVDWQGPQTR